MKTAYINAKIFTCDETLPFADTLITENGRIIWTGQKKSAPTELLGQCALINLQGKTVIPGLVDAHMHPLLLADFNKKISCLPPKINSISDLTKTLRHVRSHLNSPQWIEGWGYDEGKLAEHRSPTRYDLDEGCSDYPVSLIRTCGHIRCVNSKALEMAGIDRNTPDPPGGEIERDEDGEPTGILKENARNLITSIMPTPSSEQICLNLCDLGKLLLSQGIVAITDMGNLNDADPYPIYEAAVQNGFLQEVSIYYFWEYFKNHYENILTEDHFSKEKQIRTAGLKLIGDGSISGHTAWVNEPYLHTTQFGMPVCSDDELETAISFCKENHCQLSIHAMGARAIDRAVNRVYTEKKWTEDNTPHVRLEHITEPSENAIRKTVEKEIAFVTQPIFLYCEIESYLTNLGHKRTKQTYPIQKLLAEGVDIALSTDAPATSWAVPSDPFSNLKAAVTRIAYDGTDCGQSQKIDIETAIRLYTKESARISGLKDLGCLSPGYKADFIVLDRDIFNIPSEEIDQIQVLQTYVKGVLVYSKE